MTKVTIGGDRLGSGNKMKQHLHNYFRSTHDLSQTWTSPMTVGALYPFLVIPALRNDKFEIKLNADTITVPTKGPLFGSFKVQYDIFACPVRLYQAILHNNPTNIGLKMNQVMFPTYKLTEETTNKTEHIGTQLNNSCLWKYLGLSGLGKGGKKNGTDYILERDINAIPLLAYYDIFKNYYSNKQEEDAYVITSATETERIEWYMLTLTGVDYFPNQDIQEYYNANNPIYFHIEGHNLGLLKARNHGIVILSSDQDHKEITLYDNDLYYAINNGSWSSYEDGAGFTIRFLDFDRQNYNWYDFELVPNFNIDRIITSDELIETIAQKSNLHLERFKLKNIDDMRMAVLSHHTLGTSFKVDQQNYLPYNVNTHLNSLEPLNGLVVKTYQSDLFNNWINTEWIDGENGIAEITKIATSNGAFKLDQLNLAEKLYNMLNRVAVSGGTYEDWQDAVYDEAPHKHIESPIYCGGMSAEVVFEQIVANTAANIDGQKQPLGDLAGRGRNIKRKGGNISIKCDEACYIIGIVSITPRIKYTQGNEFYLTELKSMDDMHKPALDGIGFQNLLGERLAWFDTTQNDDGTFSRSVVGKVPAWIEYMTAVDKTYGDFAETEGKAFMSLNRNYEMDEDGEIADVTTYIDPTKYNYAFAVSSIDAQNFWTEIRSSITARRKMSAKQIPNL